MKLVLGMIVGLLMALGSCVPGLAIVSTRSLRQRPMFQLLLHMACAGVVLGLLTALLDLLRLLNVLLSPVGCQLLLALQRAAGVTWTAALAAVSVERYVAVEHGLRYFELLTPARLLILHAATLTTGLLALLLNVPDIVTPAGASPQPVMCLYIASTSDRMEQIIMVFGLTLTTLTTVMNVVVFVRGVKQDRVIRRHLPRIDSRQQVVGGHKALYAIFRLAILTTALQLPHQLLTLAHIVTGAELRQARTVAGLLRMVMFLINGWLFGYWCEDLRNRYRAVWRRFISRWRRRESLMVPALAAASPPATISVLFRRLTLRLGVRVTPERPLQEAVQ